MGCYKKLLRTMLVIVAVLWLMACTDLQAQKVMNAVSNSKKPTIPYYPYFSTKQLRVLNDQNIIGILPGEVKYLKNHSPQLNYDLNAASWWSVWPYEVQYINNLFAQEAKEKLGCGPLKAGKKFTLPIGIYSYKGYKMSLSEPLTWTLEQDIASICSTPMQLPNESFQQESLYWNSAYSENRIQVS
ncbi:MAG: hypothetical protein K0S08_2088 [Gammaproteobacteria bacterium]|jgi:hypothetical protein|nr:hypothetical protein [Gammaproteobacteria bacterium]